MAKSSVAKKSQVAEVVFYGINELPEDRKSQGVTPEEFPFPWEKKKSLWEVNGSPKMSLRGKVVWQLVNSHKEPITLTDVDNAHRSIKARKYHALIDALNGGQSPSAKATWGNPFVELFVIPAK